MHFTVRKLTDELHIIQTELSQARAELAALKAEPPQPACEWWYDESEWKWEGQCGAAWQFTDDGPVENEMRFCPGCGRAVAITPPPPAPKEDK